MNDINLNTIDKILQFFQLFDGRKLHRLSTGAWTISREGIHYEWVRPFLPKYIKQTYELLELVYVFPTYLEQDRMSADLYQNFHINGEKYGTLKKINLNALIALGESTSKQIWELSTEPPLQHIINSISLRIRSRLHLPFQIDFTFEKLIIIKSGGQYHEKPINEDSFGRLIICLPFKHSGGEVVISSKSNPQLKFSSEAAVSWAAVFGNYIQEHLPVTSGAQILVTYKMHIGRDDVNVPSQQYQAFVHWGPTIPNPTLHPQIIKQLAIELDGKSIGILLSKKYTNKELKLGMLEGHDKQVADSLMQQGCSFDIIPVVYHDYGATDHPEMNVVYSFNKDDVNHVVLGEGPAPQHTQAPIPFFFIEDGSAFSSYSHQDYSDDSEREDGVVESRNQQWYLVPALIVHFPTWWSRGRLLWIAQRKNTPAECPIAILPNDIIRYIIKMIKWQAQQNLKKRKREAEEKPKKQVIVISDDDEGSDEDNDSEDESNSSG